MRLRLALGLLLLGANAAGAQSMLGQSQIQAAPPNVVVPPAPPIMAAPLPAAGSAAPVVPAASPPGLVQTPTPAAAAALNPPASPTPPASPAAPAAASAPTATTAPAAPAAPGAPPASAAAPPANDVPPTLPNVWVNGTSATLGVLDKVDGSTTQIAIPVGGSSTIGDLTVSVQACVSRPAGAIPDSGIFLTVQPSGDDTDPPIFRGWMVRSLPAATVVGDAGEVFRVISCG
jgi:hypothetical protein